MDIVVRKYEKKDLENVNKCLEEAFNVKKVDFSSDEFTEIVCTCDGQVCGYLLLTKILNPIKNKFYYHVDYVCVLSSFRGLHLSDKLMEYAEDIARKEGAMYLELTCSSFRVAAHKLYERCGYIKRDSDIFRKELV